MCGFIAHLDTVVPDARFVSRRGPDLSCSLRREGFTFTHYLLHVTGTLTPQPFVDDDIVCLFNGEIYNHPFKNSDGEVIIPLYKNYGPGFASRLDGEFAIAIYDFARRQALFCTDAFATKPLWVNGLNAASYESCVGGVEVPPNTVMTRTFDHFTEVGSVYSFDFDNQVKDSFQDWTRAFEGAIAKRACGNCFIGLSSGYDSGAIACALTGQSVQYAAYSILGSEDPSMLEQRLRLTADGKLLTCDQGGYDRLSAHIKRYAEEYSYNAVDNGPVHCNYLTDDWGAVGSALLYSEARKDGRFVCLSGQGADEIMSDYSLYPDVSTLHGVFPDRLSPWPNFFGGCQRAYLHKEEHVAGCFGIEARYPFLDRELVQEFLWLAPGLKNRVYKAPIDQYLRLRGYPFNASTKVGFSAI